ncbi:MAG: Asp-tRNA(Asn)/Glu-tRNA(Gln) amidotransferase subunit GatB [Planctomycetota bacterium]|nr:Asp-tRNA(Asn)/Glu-tRNA(Gln) amidotransferase subunit GatB [Planctomycetota bacterium]
MQPAISQPVIVRRTLIVGLEIHVELATRTKMFSRAPSPAHAEHHESASNTLIDPTVLGLPGALPIMNRAAVEMSMLVGLALGCRIAPLARWDRKSYFYPDLPKSYQISQYDLPLCFDGSLHLPALDAQGELDLERLTEGGVGGALEGRTIGIIRAHLEEDAGKLLHEAPGGFPIDGTIADYNRAGTPLLEIVTQPDFRAADEVVAFSKLLRNICRFLRVTEGVMQRGHMRFEPNINCELVLEDGRIVRTPIVEVKNLNSFKSLKGAIEYEAREQPERWLRTGQEMSAGSKTTRGWDDVREVTLPQREKEDAHDYRYFPDPDLPPVVVDEAWEARVRGTLLELPLTRMMRFRRDYGLSAREAAAIVEERDDCDYFEDVVRELQTRNVNGPRAGRLAANWILQAGLKLANERGVRVAALGINAGQLAALAALRESGALGNQAADELFSLLASPEHRGADPHTLAQSRGLLTVRDEGALRAWCEQAMTENPQSVADLKQGKQAAIGRLVGAVMKASGGKADAKAAREKLEELVRG